MTDVNLFAYYTVQGDDLALSDAAANSVMSTFKCQSIGASTDMLTGERDIQWQLAPGDADTAKRALEANGFRVEITPLPEQAND